MFQLIFSRLYATPLMFLIFPRDRFCKISPKTPSVLDLFIKPSRSHASTLRTPFAYLDNEKMHAKEGAGNSYQKVIYNLDVLVNEMLLPQHQPQFNVFFSELLITVTEERRNLSLYRSQTTKTLRIIRTNLKFEKSVAIHQYQL